MSIRPAALAAVAAFALATPAAAQETPAQDAPAEAAAVTPSEAAASCAPKPAKKGAGLSALLSAANRAGAGDLLSGRSGQFLGSGKRSAIAGAVLGTALGAADSEGAGPHPYAGASPVMPGAGGSRGAQIAAFATGAVIGIARQQAAASASSACPSN